MLILIKHKMNYPNALKSPSEGDPVGDRWI